MSYYQNSGPPSVPPPWVAEWDGQSQRYYFVNQQSGERSWDMPSGGYGYGAAEAAGYEVNRAEQRYDYDRDRVENAGYRAENYVDNKAYNAGQDIENFPDNAARWTGNKVGEVEDIPENIEYGYDRRKDEAENWVGRKVDDVEDAPEDVANWVGRKVDDVEDAPEDVANWVGRKVQDVEDIPDDVEGWAGRRVQGVEDFGDNIDNAYDDGRNEGRDDDRW